MKDKTTPAAAFPKRDHDHAHCITDALADAAAVCVDRGVRLTTLRCRVLEIIWQSHRPLGAYAILNVLSSDGRYAAPPTVYRALDFLLEHGLIHRIDSLTAFVGCSRPGHIDAGEFLICRACGTAAELSDSGVARAIARRAAAEGFAVERHSVEVVGLCPHCR